MTAVLDAKGSAADTKHILSVRQLTVSFPAANKDVLAVDSVCFDVTPGKTLAIIGESGSGKTASCRAVVGLLPPCARVSGDIWVDGEYMSGVPSRRWESIRGRTIAMVLQDPARCLNPTRPVGKQISDAVALHLGYRGLDARREAESLMDLLNIDSVKSRYSLYPHELSGGLRQRIAIAIALAGRPRLLIADESVRALDPIAKAATLRLLKGIQRERGMAILLVSHNLYNLEGFADEIMVMFAGRAVERAAAASIFESPQMPYTLALLRATPGPTTTMQSYIAASMRDVGNVAPSANGCGYFARCELSRDICRSSRPLITEIQDGHKAACWHPLGKVPSA